MVKKVGRNEPCPCGSGKKYKACCFKKDAGPKKLSAKVLKQSSNLMKNAMGHTPAKKEEHKEPALPSPYSDNPLGL